MEKESPSRPARIWLLIAVLALLGLGVALPAGIAGASEVSDGIAEKAKAKAKKCKRKHRTPGARSAARKCKKRKKGARPVAVLPVLRAEVSWSGFAEIDLHAWSGGLHTGWSDLLPGYDLEIPGLIYQPSLLQRGEAVVDRVNPSARGLTFGVCYYDHPSTNSGPTDVSVHLVFADGSVSDQVLTQFVPGDLFIDSLKQGGEPDPTPAYCP